MTRRGPQIFAYTRGQAKSAAIDDLASKVPPETFEAAFGVGVEQLDALKTANTATIPRLLELAPAGTPDPTPYLYDVTYQVCDRLAKSSPAVSSQSSSRPAFECLRRQYVTGLLCLAAVANLMVRPAIGTTMLKAASTEAKK